MRQDTAHVKQVQYFDSRSITAPAGMQASWYTT